MIKIKTLSGKKIISENFSNKIDFKNMLCCHLHKKNHKTIDKLRTIVNHDNSEA